MWNVLRQRNFALLWFGGLVSMIGDWALMIGLPIYVYQLSGSALATSVTFACSVLPSLFLGPFAGVLIDRWDRKQVVVITNLLLALTLLPLLLVTSASSIGWVYLVALTQSCIRQFFNPAEHALLPQLVDEEDLMAANALNGLNNNLARLIGPPIGGLVATFAGLRGIALIDLASFVIAAGMTAAISGRFQPARAALVAGETAVQRYGRELADGLKLIGTNRSIRTVMILMATKSVGEGVFAVMFVIWVNTVLNGGPQQIGWLQSAQAVGGLLGSLILGWASKRFSPVVLVGGGTVLFGIIDLLIFNYPLFFPGFALGVALFVLVGIPGIISQTGVMSMLQMAAEDQFRGRVFAALGTVVSLSVLLGLAIAGLVGERFGVITILNIQGFAYIAAGLLFVAAQRIQPEARTIQHSESRTLNPEI